MSADRISFSLLENGLDFIATASTALSGKPCPRKLKYGVLHLWSGLLLLLKERLRREHWSLLYADPGRAKLAEYRSGEFIGVNYAGSTNRLNGICGIVLNHEDGTALDRLCRLRNRMEHFEIDESVEGVKSASCAPLSFALDFVTDELGSEDLTDLAQRSIDTIRESLGTITVFVETRRAEIAEAVAAAPGGAEMCPRCLETALVIDGGASCLFCRYEASGQDAAREFLTNVTGLRADLLEKEGVAWPQMTCPECEAEALVPAGRHEGKEAWRCFECGTWYPQSGPKRWA